MRRPKPKKRTGNPYLDRTEHPQHGQRSEKRVIRKMGARATIASGSTSRQKGDGRTEKHYIEAKATKHESYSVKLALLRETEKQALAVNRVPMLTISFVDESGQAKRSGDWVMVPLWSLDA